MNRRCMLVSSSVLVGVGLLGWFAVPRLRFPPDTTPEGAYMRIASSIGADEPAECFAYLEQEAQDSVYTILDYATKVRQHVETHFPADERQELLAATELVVRAPEPKLLWAAIAAERGWVNRLRRDLSGVAEVAIAAERASVVTVRGTRYPFRRRPNGIWGLTMFTAELVADAAQHARDWDRIQQVARDFERGRSP